MREPSRTNKELLKENDFLKQRIQELEISEATLKLVNNGLQESEEKLRMLLSESPDPIFSFSPEGQYRYVNRAFAEGVGKPVQDIIGKLIWDVFPQEEADKRFAALSQVLRTGKEKVIEVRVPRADGDRYYITTITPIKDSQGGIASALCSSKDITNRKRAEDALRESESRLKSISNNLPSAMIYQVVMKRDGTKKFTYLSNSARQLHGISPEEGIADPALICGNVHEEDSELLIKAENEALKTFSTFELDVRVKDPSGRIRWSTLVSTPRLIEGGSICWDGIEFDITEHKRTEEKLRKSEVSYRTLVENANDIVFRTDDAGYFTFVNQPALNHLGYKEEDVIGKHYSSFIRKDMRDETIRFFGRQFVKRIQNTYLEYPLLSKKGHKFWIGQNTQLIVEDGQVTGFQAVARNITDRRQVEEALRESEEKFRSVVERSLVGIAIIDDVFQYTYVNEEFCNIAGYEKQEILGKNLTFLLAEESKLLVAERNRRRQLGEDVPTQYEFLFVQKNGRKRTGEVRSALYLGSLGKTKVIIQVIDITERKRTDEALRESEGRYRGLVDLAVDGILLGSPEAIIIDANDFMCTLAGLRREQMMGKHISDILFKPDSLRENPLSFDLLQKGEVVVNERTILRPDLTEVQVEMRSKMMPDGTYQSIYREITERKQAEEALRKSEEKHRTIIEQMEDGYFEVDLAGNFTFVNDAECKIIGYSRDELIGMNNRQFQDEASARKTYQLFGQVYLTGKPIKGFDIEIIRKNGTKGFHEDSVSLIRDTEGKPIGFRGLSRDITERKQAEEEKRSLEERLNRAEKMEALGQLAGGVAHDLNNVLGVLSGYSELLLMEIPEGQRARGHAEKIFQSTEKGAAIIQDLLTLARRGVSVSDVINLNKVVADFLKTPVFEKMKDFNPRVTFRTECQEELLNIKGSPMHLEKTLMNLVSNAAESISGAGEVMIRTQNRYLEKPIRGYDEIKEGDYIILTVSDTGMGIPGEHREKIFEPFYTKKTMGRSGTGLGLAIVWGTIKDHNGYIDVQTEVGEGTTFTLYFPVTREELLTPQQKVPIERYLGNGESVLVVDDIAEQRDVASGLLKKLGYEVNTVSSGEAAVEYLRENKADILVLDMIMAPGIDGLETYQRVLKINPQQKAILVSGFSETDRVKKAHKLGAGAYVRKPYVLEKIGVAIRDELKR